MLTPKDYTILSLFESAEIIGVLFVESTYFPKAGLQILGTTKQDKILNYIDLREIIKAP